MTGRFELRSDTARATIDLERGGRLASLEIRGTEVLVGEADDPLQWGCYPMVPFAGRIDGGEFDFDGVHHRLPPNLGRHAIHGYGFDSPWTRVGSDTFEWEFTHPWPFRGRARQRFTLEPRSLHLEMTVDADDRQPVTVGWHPWFRRRVGTDDAELTFAASSVYELSDGIPTGELVAPGAGPSDDCFIDVTRGPRLRWGGLAIDLRSTADHWVVYDRPDHALCIEPQSGPPDHVNSNPRVIEAGASTRLDFTIDWSSS